MLSTAKDWDILILPQYLGRVLFPEWLEITSQKRNWSIPIKTIACQVWAQKKAKDKFVSITEFQ